MKIERHGTVNTPDGKKQYRVLMGEVDRFGVRSVYLYLLPEQKLITQFYASALSEHTNLEAQALRQGFGIDRKW